MAPESEIQAIELRRLAELEKQNALYGPQTEPAILIEIQDLRHKYGRTTPQVVPVRTIHRAELDYDFLMNTVSAALQRLTIIESLVLGDQAKRPMRQMVLNTWLLIVTLLLVYALFGR